MERIAEALHQQDSPQTRRMAAAVLSNAFMFHEALAGGSEELKHIRTMDELKSGTIWLEKDRSHRRVAQDTGSQLLVYIRHCHADSGDYSRASEQGSGGPPVANGQNPLLENNLMRSHDLTGTVFQRLISDRKFLAAYYTKPASAALLAGLAVNSDNLLGEAGWTDPEQVKSLRVADFSCGTGTLLSTAYQRMSQLHELHGGDSAALHPDMMSSVLLGCDILPAAAHLTASMLSSAHPTVKYDGSRVFTLPYGLQEDGSIALGSIDLLRDHGAACKVPRLRPRRYRGR